MLKPKEITTEAALNPKPGRVYKPGGDAKLRRVTNVFTDATDQVCVAFSVERICTLKQWRSWVKLTGALPW